jgi:hypothetical protein
MQRVATRPLTSAVAAVKAPAPETTGLDEEQAYAWRAVRRPLPSADAVAHARAAGALAARPLQRSVEPQRRRLLTWERDTFARLVRRRAELS